MEQRFLPAVDRFFQFALLGLVASGYLAIAGSGYVDAPTVVLAGVGLLWRAAIISGAAQLQVPERLVTAATIAYMLFAPIDYFFISQTWITATVHVVFFVASVKTLTARVARDYLFVAAIAFLELLAAALFSASGTFFLCLAAYLLCAVAALSASEVRRLGRPEFIIAGAGRVRAPARLAAFSVVMTIGVLILTAGLFFLLPRTANAALQFLASNRYHLTGFSNDVTLGEVGELKSDTRPVMHVKALSTALLGESSGELPLNMKWRGLALERFDGHRWSTDPASFRTLPPDRSGTVKVADDWQRRRPGKRIFYRVEIQNIDADALFVAGTAEFLNAGNTRISRGPGGAFRFGYTPGDTVRYEVYSYLGPAQAVYTEPHRVGLSLGEREQDLKLPQLDSRIGELAHRWVSRAVDDNARALLIEQHLRHDYGYSLDLPSTQPPDPIADFLFVRHTGYCEHFASTMTVMLRSLGIPARLVNGFQSGIANPYSGTLLIRASDAHTWVEAFLPGQGWTVFDPTPLAGRVPEQTIWTKLGLYADAADTFWRDWVLSYDLGQQLTLASRVQSRARDLRESGLFSILKSLRGLSNRAAQLVHDRGLRAAGAWLLASLAGLIFLYWVLGNFRRTFSLRRARAGRLAPREATALYQQMLQLMKRRGYHKPSWFTAQEFAAIAGVAEELNPFTEAYHAVRFGDDAAASREMNRALETLSAKR